TPGTGLDHLERADPQRHQVGADRARGGELVADPSVGLRPLGAGQGVGEGAVAGRRDDGELPRGPEGGLVERREGAPRVGRRELAEDVPPVVDLLSEQPFGLQWIEAAAIVDLEAGGAWRQRTSGVESDELVATRHDRRGKRLAPGAEAGALDLELLRVEPDPTGGGGELQVEGHPAAEGLL